MQSYLLESIEDMGLRKEDKSWLIEEIDAALRTRVDPHGWQKVYLASFRRRTGRLKVDRPGSTF